MAECNSALHGLRPETHRPPAQRQPGEKQHCSHAGRGQMGETHVADEGMHTDGGYEASRAGDGQRLPEVSRGPATPDTEEQDEAATPESATKSSAVVCNERNEARADGVEVVGGQL